jgi:hypothetical protein
MKIRNIIATTCAALTFPMAGPINAHDREAETVTKNFKAAIPNIPGKSLIALEVDYAPGAASPPHTHAKSAFIYAYVISGAHKARHECGSAQAGFLRQGHDGVIGRWSRHTSTNAWADVAKTTQPCLNARWVGGIPRTIATTFSVGISQGRNSPRPTSVGKG